MGACLERPHRPGVSLLARLPEPAQPHHRVRESSQKHLPPLVLAVISQKKKAGRAGVYPSNFYLGGSAYVAPRPSAVRLRRSSRPAARQQRHCATMDLTAQGPRPLDLRRIRIRCVRSVTKVLRAAQTPVMSFLQDLYSLSSEPGSFALIDIQSSQNSSVNIVGIVCLRSFKLRFSGSAQVAPGSFGRPPKPQGYGTNCRPSLAGPPRQCALDYKLSAGLLMPNGPRFSTWV